MAPVEIQMAASWGTQLIRTHGSAQLAETAVAAPAERTGGVTARAVMLSLALVLLLAPVNYLVEVKWYKAELSSGAPATTPIAIAVLLAGAAALLTRLPLGRRLGLTRREVLAIVSAVSIGAPLLTHGMLFWMIPKVVAFYYEAQVKPEWGKTFLSYIPLWFAPTDRRAVFDFFEGQAAVPWRLWLGPLAAWSSFLVALFVCTLCLMAIVQRQWVSHERLSFPLAQIPLETVQEKPNGAAGLPGRATWVFWLGVLLAGALSFDNTLAAKWPSLPAIPVSIVAMRQQQTGPAAGLGEIDLVFTPWLIALAYLIPKELSFSCWFFWIINRALTVFAVAIGTTGQPPSPYSTDFPATFYQGGGVALALLLWVLWIGRQHLARVLRLALRRGDDAREPLPYRWAALGALLSFCCMVYFCWAAGCRVWVGVVLIALIVGYYAMWARVRAETGIGFLPWPVEIQNGLVTVLGSAAFTPREIVALISLRWTFFPGFGSTAEVLTGNTLESYKIADAAGLNARRLTRLLVAALLVSLVFSIYILLRGFYREGYFGLALGSAVNWPSWQTLNDGSRIFDFLTNVTHPDPKGFLAIAVGAAVAVLLGVLRLRFWWWPLHPVGYLAANCWGMHWNYLPFFIGWLLKVLVTRYGGLRLYRQTLPLAIGVIVGDQLNNALWAVVALCTHGRV